MYIFYVHILLYICLILFWLIYHIYRLFFIFLFFCIITREILNEFNFTINITAMRCARVGCSCMRRRCHAFDHGFFSVDFSWDRLKRSSMLIRYPGRQKG